MLRRELITQDFLYYFNEGKCINAHDVFGSHIVKDEEQNNIAAEFILYAPNAKSVNIIAEWNGFQDWKNPMEKIDDTGIWYAYVEGDLEWKRYKYCLTTKQGETKYKSDPFAYYSDMRPSTDSKVCDIDNYTWHDELHIANKQTVYDKPMMIYEMHLGSWKRDYGKWIKYNDLVPRLIDYLLDMGYTHVEFLPVYEHPLDASWGYMGTGYFAPTSRYGCPQDLMYLIDNLHKAGISVIFDWVPGHICKDAHGLYMFDGTALYDYQDAVIRENVEWGTANLDLGKGITRSFLLSNASYFMDYYHVDGFRVDAVSNIIYYNGNKDNGVNEGACDFCRELSKTVFAKDDRVLLMAEDSSDFDGVTRPVDMGGLGFNYKWDMGWMNDTLSYFKKDPIYRRYHHHQLTFSMVYNYNEQFLLPFSHDEVVHMKGSLLNKMPGDYWQKFANYRMLLSYMMTHPGKKLLFMGAELAQFSEWHYEGQLDWDILKFPAHNTLNRCLRDLINMYKKEPALYELDHSPEGFSWIEPNNSEQSVYVYARYAKNKKDHLVVLMNATPNTYHNYKIGVPSSCDYKEIFNSDSDLYGGSNQVNLGVLKHGEVFMHNLPQSVSLTVPPLGIAILRPVYETSEDKTTVNKTNNHKISKGKKSNDLEKLTVKELREIAKNMNMHGYSKLTKKELILKIRY